MMIKDFEQLYSDFFDEIFHFFFYSLLNREEAEDLTSITFLKFYSNMDHYDEKKSLPRTYLWAIARNVLNDHYRMSYEKINIEDVEDIHHVMKKEENFNDRLILLEILSALSQKERQVLYYKYYLDMTSREISEMMGFSVTNVTSICSRALAKAKKLYKNI